MASSLKGPTWTRGDSLGSPPRKQPRPERFPASEPERESTRVWDGEERMSKGSRIGSWVPNSQHSPGEEKVPCALQSRFLKASRTGSASPSLPSPHPAASGSGLTCCRRWRPSPAAHRAARSRGCPAKAPGGARPPHCERHAGRPPTPGSRRPSKRGAPPDAPSAGRCEPKRRARPRALPSWGQGRPPPGPPWHLPATGRPPSTVLLLKAELNSPRGGRPPLFLDVPALDGGDVRLEGAGPGHRGLIRALQPTEKAVGGALLLMLLRLSGFSLVRLCATPETAAHKAPLPLGFSRQEHWSGLPFPSPWFYI